MKNAVYVICPYKTRDGIWAFDDKKFGLVCEPFVGDTNTVIDKMLTHKGIETNTFSLMFSRHKLPKSDAVFKLREIVGTSAWYWCDATGMLFWLCPALNHYFDSIPKEIFVKILCGTDTKTASR